MAPRPSTEHDLKIDVVFVVDRRFAPTLRTAVASIAANAADASALRMWIATDGEEIGAEQLVASAALSGLETRWVPVDASAIFGAPVVHPWPRAIYLRILLASAMPAHVKRLMYLDADVMVERDLVTLHSSDLGERPLGAVFNFRRPPHRGPIDFSRYPYFSAGVMLIDREAWIREEVTPRALACIAAHPRGLRMMDQDALNCAVAGNRTPLDRRWNQQAAVWELSHTQLGISRDSLESLRRRPYIVHCSGRSKPCSLRPTIHRMLVTAKSLRHPLRRTL